MSFATAAGLQTAVYQLLAADAGVTAALGTAIFDEMPPGPIDGVYASLGEGEVRDISDRSGGLAEHRITVSVISDVEGFHAAKVAAGAVTDALVDAAPVLTRGRVVCLGFQKARARRVRAGQLRRIDLTFLAIVEDD